jgi:nuclear transport factor 2 (NTF2) superfamily protein
MKMLKTNNRLQKEFDGNRNSYEFANYDMQDEYDAWWVALGNEQRAKIFAES